MASPFDIFRKNQKVMMAALVLLAMIAFVFADFFSPSGQQGTAEDPLVVTSDYFSLKESDVDRAIGQRMLVHRILTQALTSVVMQEQLQRFQQQFQGIDPSFLGEQLKMMEANIAAQARARVVSEIGLADEQSVVDTMALAETARKLGVQVSNERVDGFVFSYVNGLTKERYVEILKSQPGLSLNALYDALRREIMAYNVRYIFASNSASSSTPIDRWNYFQRKNLRASVEVLPVKTADIIKAGKVAEPTERELAAYYDEYKFYEPVPGASTPGFKVPQKASFQYFRADEAKFYAPEKITAEAIAAHYDANKSRYPFVPEDYSDAAKPAGSDAAKPDAATSVKPEASTTPGEIKPLADPKGGAAMKPEAKPEPKKPETKPEEQKPAEPKKNDEKKPEPKAEEKKADEKKPATVSPDCGDDGLTDEFSASSCADEPAKPAEDKKTDEKKADEKPADAKPSEEKKPEPAKPSAAPTATTPAPVATASPSATAAPTATATVPAVTAPVLPPLPLPSEDVMLPDDVRTGKNPQFEPLWRVEDKIRKELAGAAARKSVEDAFAKLREKMNDKALALITGSQPTGEQKSALLTEEQFKDMAKDYPEIEAKSTQLVDRIQAIAMADEPGLFHSVVGGASLERGGIPFVQAEYSNNSTFTPKDANEIPEAVGESALDAESTAKTVHYLYWKTVNEEAHLPELAKIRDQVKFAWQTEKARPLAREEAEALAKKARETPKPLSQLFPDRGVERTNSFTWYETDLSGGFGRQQPGELSKVDGVVDPGPEFMQAVFSLDVGQVSTAMNNPENICYVVHVATMEPSREQLLRDYAIDHFETYYRFGEADAQRMSREAIEALLADANIRWEREPKELTSLDQ